MAIRLGQLSPQPGARRRSKRVGRGIGSGHGKTATRGSKGQKARGSVRPGFEGGQTPLTLRLRKRKGLSKTAMPQGRFRREYAVVNVGRLERFEPDSVVTPETLLQSRVIRSLRDGLRILGEGEITRPLTVRAHHFSKAARAKLLAAGGKVEVI
jgi:large subunit ribosomal protein L15